MYYFVTLLFKLVFKFVPIDTVELKRMQSDAEAWARNIMPDPQKPTELTGNKIEILLAKNAEIWWVKLIGAFLYMYLYRAIQEFMNPSKIDDEEDGD